MMPNTQIELNKISDELVASWNPFLSRMKSEQLKSPNEAAFCGLVAFMGVHLCLWLSWNKTWASRENQSQGFAPSFDVHEMMTSQSPWICLNLAYGKNVLLSHVQTEGIGMNRDHIRVLLQPAFSHMFRSLGPQGEMIYYDQAINGLVQMGYTDYEVLAFTLASGEALPEVSQFEKVQKASSKKIPIIPLTSIETQWEAWLELAKQTQQILSVLTDSHQNQAWNEMEISNSYQLLAAMMWKKLIEAEIMVPFGEKNSRRSLFRKPKQDSYRGNVLLYGDHEAFWHKFHRDFCSEVGR